MQQRGVPTASGLPSTSPLPPGRTPRTPFATHLRALCAGPGNEPGSCPGVASTLPSRPELGPGA